MNPQLGVIIRQDPIIDKMVQLTVTNVNFRFVLSRMIANNTAFKYSSIDRSSMSFHPTDELLDAYYNAMGVGVFK